MRDFNLESFSNSLVISKYLFISFFIRSLYSLHSFIDINDFWLLNSAMFFPPSLLTVFTLFSFSLLIGWGSLSLYCFILSSKNTTRVLVASFSSDFITFLSFSSSSSFSLFSLFKKIYRWYLQNLSKSIPYCW